ncbi:hypothetical protein J0656_03355 [Muricauda ruestringensis]|uniref:Uncharacterized protein n=1 Tax=Flagellimonas aurea TaxID=2915619 RepID=A0ABS3G0Y6_9FLAO|nr:hypothetical protein [Allomuricauda aurea]MAO17368.1 hypothetical protein [Allomuricauda sp.]MBO0353040.1 hypothetical protein [Allomuricauda aurea]
MLKLNHKLNQGKNQLFGQFKLPYSLNGHSYNRPKLVDENDTKKVEHLIGHIFIGYLRQIEKRQISHFFPNDNDGHKNPDLFLSTEGKHIGVQVTQFVIRDYLARFNQAKNICEKLSDFITEIYNPPIIVNIQICTPWDSDAIPQGKIKTYKKLAKVIAESIQKNIKHLKTKNEYLNFDLDKNDFKNIAESYNLYPVPERYKSNYFGRNNIFIDYGFDYVLIHEEDIKETAEKIYQSKNGGNSEILIIWGDELHFYNTTPHIILELKKAFNDTSFKSVYFFGLYNLKDIKEKRYNYHKIK